MPLLATVGRFCDIFEANIACSALQANGIEARVCDENLARIDWGVTNAIGGMRLQVREQDAAIARELLEAWADGRDAPTSERSE